MKMIISLLILVIMIQLGMIAKIMLSMSDIRKDIRSDLFIEMLATNKQVAAMNLYVALDVFEAIRDTTLTTETVKDFEFEIIRKELDQLRISLARRQNLDYIISPENGNTGQ